MLIIVHSKNSSWHTQTPSFGGQLAWFGRSKPGPTCGMMLSFGTQASFRSAPRWEVPPEERRVWFIDDQEVWGGLCKHTYDTSVIYTHTHIHAKSPPKQKIKDGHRDPRWSPTQFDYPVILPATCVLIMKYPPSSPYAPQNRPAHARGGRCCRRHAGDTQPHKVNRLWGCRKHVSPAVIPEKRILPSLIKCLAGASETSADYHGALHYSAFALTDSNGLQTIRVDKWFRGKTTSSINWKKGIAIEPVLL